MKSFRSMHIAALCAALFLLGAAQTGRDSVGSNVQRMAYRESPVAKRHRGIEVSLVDAFSYRPYERAAELGDTPNATFQIDYFGTWPQGAKDAFEYAVNIWANILNSPVTIRIDARFSNLPGLTVGSAGPFGFTANWDGAPITNTFFPDAIADRLANIDLYPTDPADIEAEFDSTPPTPWYFGTDARPLPGTIDFVTVALHELGHGLGFIGSAFVDGGLGYWGLEILGSSPSEFLPVIYDRYTRADVFPIINFADGSPELATALTGGNLFFTSPIVLDGTSISAPARLYAPSPWEDGSSYSHLDEATFPFDNVNALMTPVINTAEARHNPGPITGEIFTDLGWALGGAVPGQPTVTSAVAAGGTLTVTWTSGGGGAPTSHRLDFYSGGTFLASVPSGAGTTANIPLPPGIAGTFGVRVIAINAAGASPASNLFNFTIGGGVPGQPTVTSAVATGGVLNVAWTLGAGATPTTHRLDFYQGAVLVAQVTVGPATNTPIPIPPGVAGTFGVHVTAFNGAIAGPTSARFDFTIGCTTPAAPVVSGGVVGGTATVSWQPVAGATSYVVSAGTSQGGTQYLPPTNVGGALSVSASGLPPGFFAWVRVVAVNACGQGPATDFLVQ